MYEKIKMLYMKEKLFAALDLGSSRIIGAVGRRDDEGNVEILFHEELESDDGFRHGRVFNLNTVSEKILKIMRLLSNRVSLFLNAGVEEDEKNSYEITCVYVSLNGRTIKTYSNNALRNNVNNEIVSQQIVDDLLNEGRSLSSQTGDVEVLSVIPQEYNVDDDDVVNPIGCRCVRIEGRYKVVVAEKLLRDRVTDEEIARIIERWTGIPVSKLMEGERDKLLHMEDILHARVVGQEEAVTKVSEAILRSRAGIQSPNRPIGSFLFLGPTGVGKTELAKTLAECLFDDEKNMVRIDMTEYMEKFSVSRLIGAPPGYVGYEEGGQLTEAVRRKPYSVILFDEVEKAHPDVFNILLQVLDDGRITDSQGRTVDFKNTVIILTSNLGSSYLLEGIDEFGEITDDARMAVEGMLKQSFRPEFLNRLDEIVFYKPLTKDNITHIIDLILKDLNGRLADKQLKCELTERAKNHIIETGYDPAFGARPLKRLVQRHVETLLARKIIADQVQPGAVLTVDVDENETFVVL